MVNVYDPAANRPAKEHGLYTITRIVTFEDSYRAEFRPDEAYDGKWINPTNPAAWEYPIALGEEACRLGFDEVQFDYVRFPSEDAAQISGQLEMTEEERTAVIEGFLREAQSASMLRAAWCGRLCHRRVCQQRPGDRTEARGADPASRRLQPHGLSQSLFAGLARVRRPQRAPV